MQNSERDKMKKRMQRHATRLASAKRMGTACYTPDGTLVGYFWRGPKDLPWKGRLEPIDGRYDNPQRNY